MPLLLLLLSFSTLLHQSLGQRSSNTVIIVPKPEQRQMINRINALRRAVEPTARNMLKMKWSNKAAESAREWAKQCTRGSSPPNMRTVRGRLCGETSLSSSYAVSWSEILDEWQAEKSNFKYGKEPSKHVYGYTQLIWHNTHEIGCAVAHCPSDEFGFHYVCRTCPAGNVRHLIATPYKDGPSCEDCPYNCEDKLCTNPCKYFDKRSDCKDVKNMFDCNHLWVRSQCKATCDCPNSII